MRSQPCSRCHCCSFWNCGFRVSAAMATAAACTDRRSAEEEDGEGGEQQAEDQSAQRPLAQAQAQAPIPSPPSPALPRCSRLPAICALGATLPTAAALEPQLVSPCSRAASLRCYPANRYLGASGGYRQSSPRHSPLHRSLIHSFIHSTQLLRTFPMFKVLWIHKRQISSIKKRKAGKCWV